MINWKYVETLESEMSIEEFEADFGVKLPEDYKALVRRANGGTPKPGCFLLPSGEADNVSNLYSFNREDSETMWDFNSAENLEYGYVAFACDSFGSKLGFRLTDNAVVFHDYDTDELLELAPSFQAFLGMLREEE